MYSYLVRYLIPHTEYVSWHADSSGYCGFKTNKLFILLAKLELIKWLHPIETG